MTTPIPAHGSHPVAVVTGATGGLGAQICRTLAQAGFSIVAGYRNSAAGAQTLVEQLPGVGHCARAAPVTDSAAHLASWQQLTLGSQNPSAF